jgi:hypothetical protein
MGIMKVFSGSEILADTLKLKIEEVAIGSFGWFWEYRFGG